MCVSFSTGLLEVRRPTLSGSTIHGLGLEAEWKGERGLDSSIHLSLFPDCGSNVTSCLMLPLPQLYITMDGTQSQSSLPPSLKLLC